MAGFGVTIGLFTGTDLVEAGVDEVEDGIAVAESVVGNGCSGTVGGNSVVDCVKRCSNRFEQICRRDFFDSFVSS